MVSFKTMFNCLQYLPAAAAGYTNSGENIKAAAKMVVNTAAVKKFYVIVMGYWVCSMLVICCVAVGLGIPTAAKRRLN